MISAIVYNRQFASTLHINRLNEMARLRFDLRNSALSRLLHVVDECIGADEKSTNERLLVVCVRQNSAHLLKCARRHLGDELALVSMMRFTLGKAHFAHDTIAHCAEVIKLLIMLVA